MIDHSLPNKTANVSKDRILFEKKISNTQPCYKERKSRTDEKLSMYRLCLASVNKSMQRIYFDILFSVVHDHVLQSKRYTFKA